MAAMEPNGESDLLIQLIQLAETFPTVAEYYTQIQGTFNRQTR